MLRSILVGYTAILILIVAGITEQNDPTDSKFITSRLGLTTSEVLHSSVDLVAGVCHRRVPGE